MSKVIHKYNFPLDEEGSLTLPAQSNIIKTGLDPDGVVSLWAEVPSKPSTNANVKTGAIRTGDPVPTNKRYLNSVIIGPFVYHLYIEL